MKLLSIIALLAANVAFAKDVTLPTSAQNVQLVDARYELVATKTAIVPIPGCVVGEANNTCDQTVALEYAEIVNVSVSYTDTMLSDEGGQTQYASVAFAASEFSAEEIALLKSAYPQWKHGFSRIPAKFAKANFNLSLSKKAAAIQLVDMKNSSICAINNESGEKFNPSCEDVIVYKAGTTTLLVASITRK